MIFAGQFGASTTDSGFTFNLGQRSDGVSRALRERLVLVDRRTFVRDCLTHTLKVHAPQLDIIGVSSINEISGPPAQLIMLACGYEDMSSGQFREQIVALRQTYPQVPIMAMTCSDNPRTTLDAIACGVCGVLPMDTSVRVSLAAIDLALAGGSFAPCQDLAGAKKMMSCEECSIKAVACSEDGSCPVGNVAAPTLRLHVAAQESVPHMNGPKVDPVEQGYFFTTREQEVLQRLKKGMQNKLIAYNLGIAESTVKVHLRNIMKKLHATNRTQVAFLTKDIHAEIALRIGSEESELGSGTLASVEASEGGNQQAKTIHG